MSKKISKSFDVKNSPPPSLSSACNPHENEGIMPRSGNAGTPGTGSNSTEPYSTNTAGPRKGASSNVFGG